MSSSRKLYTVDGAHMCTFGVRCFSVTPPCMRLACRQRLDHRSMAKAREPLTQHHVARRSDASQCASSSSGCRQATVLADGMPAARAPATTSWA